MSDKKILVGSPGGKRGTYSGAGGPTGAIPKPANSGPAQADKPAGDSNSDSKK